MSHTFHPWSPLLPQDTIDIVAPASASTEEKLSQGVRWLSDLGFKPRFPDNMIQTDVFFAAPLEQQWEHFRAALYSDSKVIWCLRGGYGSMRLIPFLEKLAPPSRPKWLVGFSDITALHLFLNQKWNWPSLHGRTISQLRPDWELNHEHQQLIDLLLGKLPELNYSGLRPLNAAAREMGEISAPIIGGNLRLIQSSLGMAWAVDPKGKMLFIEDVSERGYSVDRMLEQLHQAGILAKDIRALLIGDFTEGNEKDGKDLTQIALERFAQKVPYPVVAGLPCGHGKISNAPLPFNTPSVLKLGPTPSLHCRLS